MDYCIISAQEDGGRNILPVALRNMAAEQDMLICAGKSEEGLIDCMAVFSPSPYNRDEAVLQYLYVPPEKRRLGLAHGLLRFSREKLELENAKKRNISTEKEYKLNVEILKLESEARKSLIKAKSVDQEAEDYALGLEEMRLQIQLEEECKKGLEGKAMQDARNAINKKKNSIRETLKGNSHFQNLRERMVKNVWNKAERKTDRGLKELAQKIYGKEGAELADIATLKDYAINLEKTLENDDSRAIDEMLKDLVQFKDRLGGTPHYPDGEPLLDAEMKVPVENKDNTLIHYEYTCLYLRSMRRLALFKPVIKGAFGKDKEKQLEEIRKMTGYERSLTNYMQTIYSRYQQGGDLFYNLTGMICHSNSNGAGIESEQCDIAIQVLKEQYQLAKEENRLFHFFSRLDGNCFDQRLDNLLRYADAHKVVNKEEPDLPAPGDGSLYIKKLSEVTGMGLVSDDNLMQAPSKILEATAHSNGIDLNKVTLKWSQIEPEIRRQMFGKKFQDLNEQYMGNGKQIVVDEAVMGRIRDLMVNISGVVDEG